MGYYKDIRDLIAALERSNLLVRVDREINKDTQLHPLVRLQFRGLPEAERKAFLFTKVTDSSGRRYEIPVCLADAEIVIEGFINTELMEPEAPFGEFTGYMDPQQLNPFMEITCISRRKNPIFVAMLSQFPPIGIKQNPRHGRRRQPAFVS